MVGGYSLLPSLREYTLISHQSRHTNSSTCHRWVRSRSPSVTSTREAAELPKCRSTRASVRLCHSFPLSEKRCNCCDTDGTKSPASVLTSGIAPPRLYSG